MFPVSVSFFCRQAHIVPNPVAEIIPIGPVLAFFSFQSLCNIGQRHPVFVTFPFTPGFLGIELAAEGLLQGSVSLCIQILQCFPQVGSRFFISSGLYEQQGVVCISPGRIGIFGQPVCIPGQPFFRFSTVNR